MKTTIFVDTNFFIHCMDIENIPFSSIDCNKSCDIIIPQSVVREIDNLKRSPSNRRAKKAKKASSLFRKIVENKRPILIPSESYNLSIQIAQPFNGKNPLPDILDFNSVDDKIIAEIYNFIKSNENVPITFITDDTIASIKASNIAIPTIPIPDNWLLPAEQDPKDTIIANLKQEVVQLKDSTPIIDIMYSSNGKSIKSPFEITLDFYNELTKNQKDELKEEIIARYPIETNFQKQYDEWRHRISKFSALGSMTSEEWQPASRDAIEKYKSQAYPRWIQSIENYLTSFHDQINQLNSYAHINLELTNSGSYPADNIEVTVETFNNHKFQAPLPGIPYERTELIHLIPSPPKAPQGEFVKRNFFDNWKTVLGNPVGEHTKFLNSLHSMASFTPEKREFYWEPDRPENETNYWKLSCIEFMHQTCAANLFMIHNHPVIG